MWYQLEVDTRPEPNPRTSWITVAIAVTVAGLLATPLVLLTRGSGARPHRDVAVRKVALDALTDRGLEPSERLERLQRAADDERRVLIEVASWGTDRAR